MLTRHLLLVRGEIILTFVEAACAHGYVGRPWKEGSKGQGGAVAGVREQGRGHAVKGVSPFFASCAHLYWAGSAGAAGSGIISRILTEVLGVLILTIDPFVGSLSAA